MERLLQDHPDYVAGYLGYDLKNDVEALSSQNPAYIPFPEACLFVPLHILGRSEKGWFLETESEPEQILDAVGKTEARPYKLASLTEPFETSMEKAEYLEKVGALRNHIREGDVYEINLCREFRGRVQGFDPVGAFMTLIRANPAPFSGLQKLGDRYILCNSPERFLKRQGNQIQSQPMKGTAPRSPDPEKDAALALELRHSEKEIAENMMIMDLVRNDLARSCESGSVSVEEMFGVYSFKDVHQMVTTVSGTLKSGITESEILKYAFPMGSMTGAPKIKAMELIERYENAKRGPFSGTMGYFRPGHAFDLNVIIRSLFYDQETRRISYQAGGAITWDSNPEEEFRETVLKGSQFAQLFGK